jgi:hypothetical protein
MLGASRKTNSAPTDAGTLFISGPSCSAGPWLDSIAYRGFCGFAAASRNFSTSVYNTATC